MELPVSAPHSLSEEEEDDPVLEEQEELLGPGATDITQGDILVLRMAPFLEIGCRTNRCLSF